MATRTVSNLQEEFKEHVIRLQADAKSEFENQVDGTKQEIAELGEDDIDQFVRNKFKNLNESFLRRPQEMEKYVLSKKPEKPMKKSNETIEEYKKRQEDYKANLELYQEFISWSMTIIVKLMYWLDELLELD